MHLYLLLHVGVLAMHITAYEVYCCVTKKERVSEEMKIVVFIIVITISYIYIISSCHSSKT